MQALMDQATFRTALEDAIKGKSANKSPFSIAWAEGKLSRTHLARWAENHYHYVGPFADYLGYVYARMPLPTSRRRTSCSVTCMRKKSAAIAIPTC